MDGVLDILLSASFWAAAIRIATPYMFGVLGALLCERSGVLNLGIEGIFTAGAMAGWMSVYLGADLWTGVADRSADRRDDRPAARAAHRAARPVAARHRHRHHAVRDEPRLFHLPARAAERRDAADHRAVPAAEYSGPLRPAVHRPGAVPADAADVPRACAVRRRRLRALPHAARPCDPRGRRESGRRRGAGTERRGDPHRRGRGGLGADGARRRVPHHVGVQRVLLRDDQRARLDLRRAHRVRLMAARQGARSARCCSARSTRSSCGCSIRSAASCRGRCS